MNIPASNRWQWTGSELVLDFGERAEEFKQLAAKSKKLRGGFLSFAIDLPRRPRSTGEQSQNHAFNGACQQIAESTGNDMADVKKAVKRRAFSRGLRWKVRDDGTAIHSLVDGELEPISEQDMTLEECGWCIDEAIILAAELGIILKGFK